MIGKRQVLKVVSATKRKKVEEFRIFWNHYHSFEIEGMNSILRDAWKEIPVCDFELNIIIICLFFCGKIF